MDLNTVCASRLHKRRVTPILVLLETCTRGALYDHLSGVHVEAASNRLGVIQRQEINATSQKLH